MTNKNKLQPQRVEVQDIPLEALEEQFRNLITSYLLNASDETVNQLSTTFPPPGYDIELASERVKLHDDLAQNLVVLHALRQLFKTSGVKKK